MAELGKFAELVDLLAEKHQGVSLIPVRAGTRAKGWVSKAPYTEDGWEIGYLHSAVNGGDLAIAPTIAEAVERAIEAVQSGIATHAPPTLSE